MKVHDLSLPLSPSLPTWPGDPPFQRELATAIARGDPANVSRLVFGAHTGTHVDAPVHFIEGGRGIETIPLEVLVGECVVVEAEGAGRELVAADLPGSLQRATRVLFKTRNSQLWARGEERFARDFTAVGEELARELVRREVKLVGVDYLSVEAFDAPAPHPVHHILLEAGLVVVEGLDLSRVTAGTYDLFCLPLKLVGSDGGPARVVLVERDS